MQLYHGMPFEPGCYNISGEGWLFNSEDEAKEVYNAYTKTKTYSKIELGFHGESGEEYDWIAEHDIFAECEEDDEDADSS